MAAQNKPKRLGEILIEQKALKEEDLKIALQVQKEQGGLLGEILVEKGFVSEEDVVVSLSEQLGYPYLPVSSFVVNEEAVKSIPAELALQLDCLPVDKIDGALAVVMADPSNQNAIRKLESAAGCPIQAFVGTASEIESAIRRCYGEEAVKTVSKPGGGGLKNVLKNAAEKRKK